MWILRQQVKLGTLLEKESSKLQEVRNCGFPKLDVVVS
jgi:hypothetical protein